MNPISAAEALQLLTDTDPVSLLPLLTRAEAVRRASYGDEITACAILNAKSGHCTENCAFCPQSVFAETQIDTYPLVSADEMAETSDKAADAGASRFGIVTSGRTVDDSVELETLAEGFRRIVAEGKIRPCGSLGILEYDQLKYLKEAGMERYHHNLETAGTHYASICTTRTYADQLRTVRDAKRAGLSVCSGGIFGLGESDAQRIELLETLREEGVDSVPVNFLNALPGTRMAGRQDLTPLKCLRIIAVARLMLPQTKIRICGGREHNLRAMQSWIFVAGADAMMIGDYLTTSGSTLERDLQMIRDAGCRLGRE